MFLIPDVINWHCKTSVESIKNNIWFSKNNKENYLWLCINSDIYKIKLFPDISHPACMINL